MRDLISRINKPASQKIAVLFAAALAFNAGCAVNIVNENITPTPDFVTATLPATPLSQPAAATIAPAPSPTHLPIEGMTTTQVNVRSEPATIGNTLGMILPFTKVQILGKESNGAWYQIVYPASPAGRGWVTATYVQVNAATEIPVVQTGTGSTSGLSGLVIQPINIRSGPGKNYPSLETLSPNDVVTIVGKDSSGDWMQIEFKNETGWAASEFLRVSNADKLPVTAQADATETPISSAPVLMEAVQDGDSAQLPSASITLSPSATESFQFNGNVSSPNGDAEDWLQFTAIGASVLAEVKCPASGLQVELWRDNQPVQEKTFSCEETKILEIQSGQPYFFRIVANKSEALQITEYRLKLEVVH